MEFAIRAAVMSAIAIAFYLTRGFGSFVETFVMIFIASLASQEVVLVLRRIRGGVVPTLNLVVIGGAIVVAIGLFALVVGPATRGGGPLRYVTVEEVVTAPDRWLDRELQVHGYVELGSMKVRVEQHQPIRTFILTTNKRRLQVRFAGIAPDTLQERAEVLARGQLAPAGDGTYLLEAREVIAKCPSTYQTANGPVPASRFR